MAKRSFTRYVEQEMGVFPHFVVCAVLEWVLIILLFIDGFLAFLANEFAKFFELRVPCLFCTRIDHVLVHKNADFYYNNSICESHKKDISSLAYCHNHKKLSDIRKMCEVCLLSFATEKESDCNTYKSLVGILHKDLECFVDEDNRQVVTLPMGKKDEDFQVEMEGDYCCCSCCGESLKVKSSNSKGKNGTTFSQAPSPRASFATMRSEEKTSLELPHVRYTELKLLSESEAELVEDDDGIHGRNLDAHPFKEDVKAVKMPLLPEVEDGHETLRTPNFGRGNKFFGIPLTDSANNSPRWAIRNSRKSPLERSEIAAETYEATDMLGPGDNDSILNCLKRQVRIDRKSLMELYMELDEERSASAVAANNAMAMITRLQAEKAAVQMEALQYQRMMEEQAEYDQEALQATNDLLAKREEEIKALEAEIEAYREKYGYLEEGSFRMSEDEISDEDYQEIKSQAYLSSDEKSECSTPFNHNFDVTILPSTSLKIAGENSKVESANNRGLALPFSQGKAEGEDQNTSFSHNKENLNNLDVTILPSAALEIAEENSKVESTNNHGLILSFSPEEAEGEEHKPSTLKIAEENSKEESTSTNNHEVNLSFSPGKAEGEEENTPSPSKENLNNLDVTILHSAALEIAEENSKVESANNHGLILSFSPEKVEGEEQKPSSSKIAEENSKKESTSTNNHGVNLPFSQGKVDGEEQNTPFNHKENLNNLDVTILPSAKLEIAEENSKVESTNNHGLALPFSQGKAEGEDQNTPPLSHKKENLNNLDVTIVPSTLKIAEENNKEESTSSTHNPGVNLPSSQGKAEEEEQKEPQTNFLPQKEPLTNFKGKAYLLGRLTKTRHVSKDDGIFSQQSSSGSMNKVGEEYTGEEKTSPVNQQLSHLNQIVSALKADGGFSKQKGDRYLAEISNNLRKLNNLVDKNADS